MIIKKYNLLILFVNYLLIFNLNNFAASADSSLPDQTQDNIPDDEGRYELARLMRSAQTQQRGIDSIAAQYELASKVSVHHKHKKSLVVLAPLVFFILKLIGNQAVKVVHKIIDGSFLDFMAKEAENIAHGAEQIIDSSFLEKFFQTAYPRVTEAIKELTGTVSSLKLNLSSVEAKAKEEIDKLALSLNIEQLAKKSLQEGLVAVEQKYASMLSNIIHPSFLSAGLTGGVFFVKKIFNFTFSANAYGSQKLNSKDELRIIKIIQENTGTTFKNIKIRINNALGNAFNQSIAYIKTGKDEFLFIKSAYFISSLNDDELKYAVLRELLFVKYDYEIKKFIQALIFVPLAGYLFHKFYLQYFATNSIVNNKTMAVYCVALFELAYYLLNYSGKIKDEIYIHTFDTMPELKAAISYYKKVPLYRYARNNKIKLFKEAINKLEINNVQ